MNITLPYLNAQTFKRLLNLRLSLVLMPLLLGLLASLGFAPHLNWPATLAALSLLFFLISFYDSLKDVLVLTLLFGIAFQASSLWWLNFVMMDFGQMPRLLSYGVTLFFALYLSLPYALLTLLCKKLVKNSVTFNLCALPLSWLVADLIVGVLFTGFPWTYVGYSCLTGPFSAFAPLIGVKGINLLLYIAAGAITLTLYRNFIYLPVAGIIAAGGILLMGLSFTRPDAQSREVTLVQGNIKQEVKWHPDMVMPTLSTYWELSSQALKEGRLVIYPESAIPLMADRALPFLSDLNEVAKAHGSYLVTGIQQRTDGRVYNSITVLGDIEKKEKQSTIALDDLYFYNKRHLVPFGEFVPLEDLLRPLGSVFVFPMSAFSEGEDEQAVIEAGELKLIPAICYESIFPELIKSLDGPDIQGILMLSNDSWFGPTRGPLEHLAIAKMRTLELQKPMLRVTNSGISAYLSHQGQELAVIPSNEAKALDVSFTGYTGQTPYSKYGDYILTLLMLVLLILSARGRKAASNPAMEAMLRLLRP